MVECALDISYYNFLGKFLSVDFVASIVLDFDVQIQGRHTTVIFTTVIVGTGVLAFQFPCRFSLALLEDGLVLGHLLL